MTESKLDKAITRVTTLSRGLCIPCSNIPKATNATAQANEKILVILTFDQQQNDPSSIDQSMFTVTSKVGWVHLKSIFICIKHFSFWWNSNIYYKKDMLTWKYEDIKVLSTTTKQSGSAFSRTTFTTPSMSINCIVGLVGVSIHTIYK